MDNEKKHFLGWLIAVFLLLVAAFFLVYDSGVSLWPVIKHGGTFSEVPIVSPSATSVMNYQPLNAGGFSQSPDAVAVSSTFAKVTKVFDGDTIEIAGGEHVRYIGVDSPEEWYSKKATTTNTCYAEEAKKENEWLVLGKTVRLAKDTRDRDIYGRLLRYVYVAPPLNTMNTDETFVNSWLVADGAARAAAYPPDTKFKDYFADLERQAWQQKAGLWGRCGSVNTEL